MTLVKKPGTAELTKRERKDAENVIISETGHGPYVISRVERTAGSLSAGALIGLGTTLAYYMIPGHGDAFTLVPFAIATAASFAVIKALTIRPFHRQTAIVARMTGPDADILYFPNSHYRYGTFYTTALYEAEQLVSDDLRHETVRELDNLGWNLATLIQHVCQLDNLDDTTMSPDELAAHDTTKRTLTALIEDRTKQITAIKESVRLARAADQTLPTTDAQNVIDAAARTARELAQRPQEAISAPLLTHYATVLTELGTPEPATTR